MVKNKELKVKGQKEVEIEEGEFDIKKSKTRITTYIDYSNYTNLIIEAKGKDIGYQTLLNQIIKAYFETNNDQYISNHSSRERLVTHKELEEAIEKFKATLDIAKKKKHSA